MKRASQPEDKDRPAWRTFEERAEADGYRRRLQQEFPDAFEHGVDRREALRYLGASMALAGLTSCETRRSREIVPYVRQPEALVPGKPLFFATAFPIGSSAIGVLCESHEGRPIKVEGNPDHPASLGATGIFAQAEVLTLWDPARSKTVLKDGRIGSWGAFDSFLRQIRPEWLRTGGRGVRLLTGLNLSPTLADQMDVLLRELPEARWTQYEPLNRDAVYEGTRRAFGRRLNPVYRFDRADVVVSLGSDFMRFGPGAAAYAKQFARRRSGEGEMNRLYVAEPMPTVTGLMADHRFPARSSEIEGLARALASAPSSRAGTSMERRDAWLAAAAADLAVNRGRGLVVVGDRQPPQAHALAHALNARNGAVGETVFYTQPIETTPNGQESAFAQLIDEMRNGQVETLVILGANPVYASRAASGFAESLDQVPNRIHLGLFWDETAKRCNWHLPATHVLEHWSDARTFDGTASVIQPLIDPLYESRSVHEVTAALSGDFLANGLSLVRAYWRKAHADADFDRWWRQGLYRGVLEGTRFEAEPVEPAAQPTEESATDEQAGIELSFGPDPTIYDGRYAENTWLQELPKPIVSLTWDNAAYMSEATARRLDVWNEDAVEIRVGGRAVEAPVWVTPGHADDAITLHLGYGRESSGEIRGFNAYELLPSDGGWTAHGAEPRKLGRRWALADRQRHQRMEGRNLAVSASLGRYRRDPNFVTEIHPKPEPENTLLPQWEYDGYKWGMAIDLSACMGCGACTLACQAENNIPVVGKEGVIDNRAMHWIRVDYYFDGPAANPEIIPQPVPCMHCENAPCELVCPVGATVHSAEGLNQMVYNRCVGTRYCSNNCPYKVRRFNFLDFSGVQPETYNGRMNPDVTVRNRGVMEKCTYCIQRIETARIDARKEERPIRDGEILTACQQVCPTEAIVFGDLNDSNSRVSQAKRSPRDYGLLLHLNTKPRTSYAVRLKNRNETLKDGTT